MWKHDVGAPAESRMWEGVWRVAGVDAVKPGETSEVGAALHDRPAVCADQLAAAPPEPIRPADLAEVGGRRWRFGCAGTARVWRRWRLRVLGHASSYRFSSAPGVRGSAWRRFLSVCDARCSPAPRPADHEQHPASP